MIKSMTGFAHGDFAAEGLQGSFVLKSWNNRYLDLALSLPPWLSKLEPKIRDFLSTRITHGKVDFSLRARSLALPAKASADLQAVRSVSAVLRQIAEAAGIEEPLRLGNVLSIEGILAFDRDLDEEELWTQLGPALKLLFEDYDGSRKREGGALLADILANLVRIDEGLALIRSLVPEIEVNLRRTVKERFAEVLGDSANEGRMLAEIASLLMKYTINEEVVRLSAHTESFRRILDTEASPGKKLDFLCQEMNREVNTIGSKSMLLKASETVVELKDALENIREQLRNVE